MTSTNDSDSTGDGYNPEDIPYWAYVISKLPPLDNIFWKFVKYQSEMMTILEIQVGNGMYQGVKFARND